MPSVLARLTLTLFAALVVAFPASSLAAPAKMYWTAGGSEGSVGVGGLLGEGAFDPHLLYPGEHFPAGIALDPASNRVYWSARTAAGDGAIRVGALDGSTAAATLYETPGDGSLPLGLGIWGDAYPGGGKLFWAQQPAGGGAWSVWGGMTGGSYRGLFEPVPGGPANALVIDPVTKLMYWTNGSAIEIGNATSPYLRYVLRSTAGEVRAVAYAQGRIYWVSAEGDDLAVYSGTVAGSDVEPLYEEEDSTPLGGLVVAGGKIYWTTDSAAGLGTIMSGNLGGGGSPQVLEPGLGAQFIALLNPAESIAPPQVTGGGKVGQKLSCEGDRWSEDLPAQSSFAAPRTVSYEWRYEGVLAGTGRTLTPTETGFYWCSALGKNAAGSEWSSSDLFQVKAAVSCRDISLTTPAGVGVTTNLPCTGLRRISYVLASLPRHGKITAFDPATGSVRYEPNSGFTGTDSFPFYAVEGDAQSSSAKATIEVTPAPAPERRSNRFRVMAPRLNLRSGTARLRLQVPGPGVLSLRGKRVRAARVEVGSAGVATLTVRPKPATRRQLVRRGRARVKVVVRFAPDGGSPRSLARAVTLRLK